MKPAELPTLNSSHGPERAVPFWTLFKKVSFGEVAVYFKAKESRSTAVLFVIAFCLLILIIPNVIMERSSQKEVSSLQKKQKEFSVLMNEYASLKDRVDVIERKNVSSKASGVAESLEEVFSSIGVKSKLKSFRSAGSKGPVGDLREENSQAQVEKVTLNELINIFYGIENAPMRLVVKNAVMKKSFENPELLDVTMSVSLFNTALQQR